MYEMRRQEKLDFASAWKPLDPWLGQTYLEQMTACGRTENKSALKFEVK
jgi:hypothetical protein